VTELEAAVAEREETVVAADIRERIGGMRVGDEGDKGEKDDDEADEAATGTVAGAVAAVSDAAFLLSLARFAVAYDLTRPTDLVDDGVAVRNARNLFIDGEVQPVSYAIGSHSLAGEPGVASVDAPPTGDRVSVLTGRTRAGKPPCWRRCVRWHCWRRWGFRCRPRRRRSVRSIGSCSTDGTPPSTPVCWSRR